VLRWVGPLGSSPLSFFLFLPSLSRDRSLSHSMLYPLRSFSLFYSSRLSFSFFFILPHKNSSLYKSCSHATFFTSKCNAVLEALAALCANDMPNCNHAKIQAALYLAFSVNRNLILTLCLLRLSLRSCANKILDQVTALHGPTLDPVYQQLHIKQKLLHWLTIQSRRLRNRTCLNFSIKLAKTILSDKNVWHRKEIQLDR